MNFDNYDDIKDILTSLSIEQALDLIRTVEGIEETNTSIILSDELDNR